VAGSNNWKWHFDGDALKFCDALKRSKSLAWQKRAEEMEQASKRRKLEGAQAALENMPDYDPLPAGGEIPEYNPEPSYGVRSLCVHGTSPRFMAPASFVAGLALSRHRENADRNDAWTRNRKGGLPSL
jgi:hypothetical protein